MAGTVVVDAVKSSTTGAPTFQNTSGTEIGTLCRAWVNWNGSAGATIRASFNVSSVTRNTTGDYTISFTNAMPDASYSAQGTTSRNGDGNAIASNYSAATATTTSIRVRSHYYSGALDSDFISWAIFR